MGSSWKHEKPEIVRNVSFKMGLRYKNAPDLNNCSLIRIDFMLLSTVCRRPGFEENGSFETPRSRCLGHQTRHDWREGVLDVETEDGGVILFGTGWVRINFPDVPS